jgi:hypothetical protein
MVMPRSLLKLLVLAVLAVPCAATAQQSLPTKPPPNPHGVVSDQRLENVDQRLLTAGEQMRLAAEAKEDGRTQKALQYGRDTLGAVRSVFEDLPPDRQQAYRQACDQAAQALETGDPGRGAEAFKTLQQRIRELARQGA